MERYFALLFFLFLFINGCASTPQTRALLKDPGELLNPHQISNVPFIEQTENYCGPASLAMVANWTGLSVTANDLAPKMYTPAKKGTFQSDYVGAARRLGLFAVNIGTLKNMMIEVSHDHPVVVLQNLGSTANPVWHYAVLLGYDLANEEVVLHSGKDQNLRMSLSGFERTWRAADNWALLILPPGSLPVTASLPDDLFAATALERVNKNKEANLAYQSILKEWPDNVVALFGLGNTYASLGNLHEAVAAVESALKLDPSSGAILNNLTEVKRKLKKRKKSTVIRKLNQ